MSWFSSLISGGVDKVVDSVATGLDSLFTSDQEKLLLRNELEKAMNKFKVDMESQITARWESDNEHFVTRLVRPVSYIFMLSILTIIMFMDGNIGEFSINPAYIPLVETLTVTMTLAYFGSRGVEKVTRERNKKRES